MKKIIEKNNDVELYSTPREDSIVIRNTQIRWYRRLWYLLSNPFLYLLTGKIRW